MYAVIALGDDDVQVGSRFVWSQEASSHVQFKEAVVKAGEGDTQLSMKKLVPVRLLKNEFYHQVAAAELRGADEAELTHLLGRARAKKGMFEGDLAEGELEIGQVAALINEIKPAGEIVAEMVNEFNACVGAIPSI